MPKNTFIDFKLEVVDLGLIPYRDAWDMQHRAVTEVQENTNKERLYLVEHHPVFTLGFHGDASNMLVTEQMLEQRGIECIRIERGGDITYHGPGQMVVYPIINLHQHHLGVKAYVNLLEKSVIQLLAEFSIEAERDPDAPGVWLEVGTVRQRKIAALGVKVTHGVTMHGLALNVNTNLTPFSYINPCGFADKGVTSMAIEKGSEIDMCNVKKRFIQIFINLLETATIVKSK